MTFYDSLSYDLLHEMDIFVKVDGDIETNRLSVNMDRDVINIVSRKGSQQTVLSYRLKEVMEEEESETEKVTLQKKLCNNVEGSLKRNGIMNFVVERDEGEVENANTRQRTTGRRNSRVTAMERRLARRKKRRRRRLVRNDEFSNESYSETDSDEWIP